ncbi:hypothetical protein [Streptomyces sp. NPDC001380]|uniref:hypothetical protein n=1 Tax=Streptomyces sp. NPDC001380 TaxID=3364566 RepID=UPI003681A3AF
MSGPAEATLEDFYHLAEDRTASAAQALPRRILSGTERIHLVRQLVPLVEEVDRHLGDYAAAGRYAAAADPQDAAAVANARRALRDARSALQRSAGPRRPDRPVPPNGARGTVEEALARLDDARRFLALARDVMAGHHAEGGRADTPYGALLAAGTGQRFVAARLGHLAGQAARFGRSVVPLTEQRAGLSLLSFEDACRHLARAGAHLRPPDGTEVGAVGHLPVAVAPAPARIEPDEGLTARLRYLASGADRLQTAAYQAVHRPSSAAPYHAAALRGTAYPLALSHLLAGRLLHTVAAALDGGLSPEAVRTAGEHLRAAAQAWQQVTPRWERLQDLGDPPGLRPAVHPSTAEAEALAVRVGRILYSDDWTQHHPPGSPRPAAELLAEGPGALLQALHRIPAAAAVHAEYAPALVDRLAGRLVTDDGMVDPRRDGGRRWFPAQPVQITALRQAYVRAETASGRAAYALADLAESARLLVPRAELDRAAHLARHAPDRLAPVETHIGGWRAVAREAAPALSEAAGRPTGAGPAAPADPSTGAARPSWRDTRPRQQPARDRRDDGPRRADRSHAPDR